MTESAKAGIMANLGFIAWFVYETLALCGYWTAATVAGLAVIIAIIVVERRISTVKILDCTSLAFFVIVGIALATAGAKALGHYHVILAWGVFALVTWVTIIAGFPFTLQYAREQTPPEVWHQPQFIRTNLNLTLVWALIFTVNTALAVMALHGRFVLMLALIIPGASMVLGYAVSRIYPERARRRYGLPPAQGAASG
ncbi:MAG: hypothetical protein ACREQN_00040 [Candidatus Binataceae bacterium]